MDLRAINCQGQNQCEIFLLSWMPIFGRLNFWQATLPSPVLVLSYQAKCIRGAKIVSQRMRSEVKTPYYLTKNHAVSKPKRSNRINNWRQQVAFVDKRTCDILLTSSPLLTVWAWVRFHCRASFPTKFSRTNIFFTKIKYRHNDPVLSHHVLRLYPFWFLSSL